MVFSGPYEIIPQSECAPPSSEQVPNANLKSLELDRALGLTPERDPSEDENNQEQVEEVFSVWDEAAIAKKNALLNIDIDRIFVIQMMKAVLGKMLKGKNL